MFIFCEHHLEAINFNSCVITGVRQPHQERMITALLQLHYQVYEAPNAPLHSLHINTQQHINSTFLTLSHLAGLSSPVS